jgi:hypothetical protein
MSRTPLPPHLRDTAPGQGAQHDDGDWHGEGAMGYAMAGDGPLSGHKSIFFVLLELCLLALGS